MCDKFGLPCFRYWILLLTYGMCGSLHYLTSLVDVFSYWACVSYWMLFNHVVNHWNCCCFNAWTLILMLDCVCSLLVYGCMCLIVGLCVC